MTEGNVIDYDWILHDIEEMARKFAIRRVAFDPWNASWMAQKLTNLGLEAVEARQGFVSMSAPMKELEKLVISRKLAHGGNAVAGWMASNVVASQDAAGNLKPARNSTAVKGIVESLENYRRLRVIAKMLETGHRVLNSDSVDVDKLHDDLADHLSKARKGSSDVEEMIHMGKGNNSNKIVKQILDGEAVTLIPTGFEGFDSINGGLPLGGVLLLTAPTGRGKTAIALQLAQNMSDRGADTAFVEMEMDHAALMTRRLANVAGISMHKLMEAKKKLGLEEKEKAAAAHIERNRLLKKRGVRETFWVPGGDVTMNEVLRTLRPYGHQVIIIDYQATSVGENLGFTNGRTHFAPLIFIVHTCKQTNVVNDDYLVPVRAQGTQYLIHRDVAAGNPKGFTHTTFLE
jgi:hypothetical protein